MKHFFQGENNSDYDIPSLFG